MRDRIYRDEWGRYQGSSELPEVGRPWNAWIWLAAIGFVICVGVAAATSDYWIAILGFVLIPVSVIGAVMTDAARERECEDRGHDPYRPFAGRRDLRCWHCGAALPRDYDPEVHRAATAQRQSYYSNRR